jgi:antitoxin component YwqK of YwqJK toxin-antitoxin module
MIRLSLFCLVLISFGCNQNLEKVKSTDDYGYTEVYKRDKEDYAKEGVYERFNEQGIKVEEAQYKNDTLDGYRVLYSEAGDTQVVENYVQGRFEGPFRAYYESGALEIEANYEYNELSGIFRRYYKNGQMMEELTFRENLENGPFKEWHENGNLKAEGTYRNGDNEHGLLKIYDEQGELSRTMNCENGICHTIWSKEKDNRNTDE